MTAWIVLGICTTVAVTALVIYFTFLAKGMSQ